ncbi:hypothetical protein CC85DRAFT_71681 [Cutaneotrichosporon oleaginosum]|uniref:RING-type domain-containing protein n=1 Tax=Cutaneotrichosporon oleaginosum TaxID=879819 RepID=A0A0J0XP66_9TREE|nr:uncharacterized protein CC85DRAFT_71681 [Cutaneotrichosporon oleaginosum]KLT42893.1 hypothetical protein CC85DRAFT_71681 [Cutaneotrichosporon oleaginosum]TXT12597.1 hypothetical protein COLE_03007 [Cutaneotrichosporon oleaginosum]
MLWSEFENAWKSAWDDIYESQDYARFAVDRVSIATLRDCHEKTIGHYPFPFQIIIEDSLSATLERWPELKTTTRRIYPNLSHYTFPQLLHFLYGLVSAHNWRDQLQAPISYYYAPHYALLVLPVRHPVAQGTPAPLAFPVRLPRHTGNVTAPGAPHPPAALEIVRPAPWTSPAINKDAYFGPTLAPATPDDPKSPTSAPFPDRPPRFCVFCHAKPSDQAPYQCMHVALCGDCLSRIVRRRGMCPVCSNDSLRPSERWRVYFP